MARLILVWLVLLCSGAFAFDLKSNDFKDMGYLPSECAYDNRNMLPSLYWTDIPEGTCFLKRRWSVCISVELTKYARHFF